MGIWFDKLKTGYTDATLNGNGSGSASEYSTWSAGTGPTIGVDPQTSATFINYLVTQNISCVRYIFSWEGMQNGFNTVVPATGTNYQAFWTVFITTVKRYLAANIYVMLEPWQYNPNNDGGDEPDVTYRGASFTATQFGEFWGPFAAAVNAATNNDPRVSFGLMNEPFSAAYAGYGVGVSSSQWTLDAQAAITAIRNTGATNTIWFPFLQFCDPTTWVSYGADTQFLTLTDPANNLGITVHNYYQPNNNATDSTALTTDSMNTIVTWSKANGNVKIYLGEMAITNGSNGDGGNSVDAAAQWAAWNTYASNPSNNIVGWNWWFINEGGGSGQYEANASDTSWTAYGTMIESSQQKINSAIALCTTNFF